MRRRHALLPLLAPLCAAEAAARVPLAVGEHGAAQQWAPWFELLAAAAGLQWELQPLPWPRAQVFAESGAGLVFGLARTPQRLQRFVFSLPVLEVASWALVRQGEAGTFRDGFAQRTLCMARGSSYPTGFAERGIAVGQWLESDQGDPATLRMLLAGRCDAAVLTVLGQDAAAAARRLQDSGIDLQGVELLTQPLAATPLHFATGLRSPWRRALQRVDEALQRERRALDRLLREAG